MSRAPDPVVALAPGRAYLLLDVFAERPLEGNQLAVFTAAEGLDEGTMQALACEMNLSESVFLLPPRAGGDARLRIFTPSEELPFAGHPVLGASVVVAQEAGRDEVALETGAGEVRVRLEPADGRSRSGVMEQPLPEILPFAGERELLAALGVAAALAPVEEYRNGPRHLMVMLGSEAEVAALDPDPRALREIAVGLCVSCFAGAGTRFKTRMFAPGLGVDEDPATGSAAGPIAVHACRHGAANHGRELEIRQGIEIGRPSLLRACAEVSADGALASVRVGGTAVFVGRGEVWPAGSPT